MHSRYLLGRLDSDGTEHNSKIVAAVETILTQTVMALEVSSRAAVAARR